MNNDDTIPHAVRWVQRKLPRSFAIQYSRWHWTVDAAFTICGIPIQLIADGPALLPESHEDVEKVNCKKCLKILKNNNKGEAKHENIFHE